MEALLGVLRAFTALGERLAQRGVVAFATRDRDIADLRTLAVIAGVNTVQQVLDLCARFFPGEELRPRARSVLEDIFTVP